jgi:geranylgeranyl diphosphate synthase type II
MDNDDFRRGRPTCHRAYGEALAILVGDALLARAFELLATEISPPEVAVACCATLAYAAGPENLVGGQADDMGIGGLGPSLSQMANLSDLPPPVPGKLPDFSAPENAGHTEGLGGSPNKPPGSQGDIRTDSAEESVDLALRHVRSIHSRKTGALIWAAVRMGGLVAQAGKTELEALEHYGRKLGLAFQIVDDLLDACGDIQEMGKRVRKDQKQGKWTYPGVIGIDGSRREADRLIREACEALCPLGERATELVTLAQFVLHRRK